MVEIQDGLFAWVFLAGPGEARATRKTDKLNGLHEESEESVLKACLVGWPHILQLHVANKRGLGQTTTRAEPGARSLHSAET